MTDQDAFWHEMAEPTSPQRLGHEPDEHVLDSILDRQPLPPSAAYRMQVLTSKLTELTAPEGAGALAGEAAAMSAFRRRFSPASTIPLPLPDDAESAATRHRASRWHLAGRARLAGVVAVLAVILGGGSVAAYAGALPAPVQDLAHQLIGAPSAHNSAGHDHGKHRGQSQAPSQQQRSSTPGKAKGRSHSAARGKAAGHRKSQHPVHPAHPGKKSGKKKHAAAAASAAPEN